MAIGRVKESTLKVFGNDYPTPYSPFYSDFVLIANTVSEMELVYEIISMLLTSPQDTFLHWTRWPRSPLSSLIAPTMLATKPTTSAKAKEWASSISSKLCEKQPDLTINMRLLVGGMFSVPSLLIYFDLWHNDKLAVVVTFLISQRTLLWQRKSLGSKRHKIWRPCVGTCGTGRPGTHKGTDRHRWLNRWMDGGDSTGTYSFWMSGIPLDLSCPP